MKTDNLKIANIYANTLYKQSIQEKQLDKTYDAIKQLQQQIIKNETLNSFFKTKLLKASKKIEVINALQKKISIPKNLLAFLELICTKRREHLIIDIILQFEKIYYTHHQTLQISITSAQKLTAITLKTIETKLKKSLKAQAIVISSYVKEDLIGGMLIEYDNKILDLSILNELKNIEKQLIAI